MEMKPTWHQTPPHLSVSSQEVHVWRVDLAVGSEHLTRIYNCLSPDECQRASRFRFERDRQRFIAARGSLRHLLGRYLAILPAAVQFCYGERGKPAIAYPPTHLTFNLAHSHDQMLCTVTQHHRVGVDLEFLRATPDQMALARRFFQPGEVALLTKQPKTDQQWQFFRLWTGKEAVLKAVGTGLVGLATVELTLVDKQLQLMRLEGDRVPASQWFLQSLIPAVGWIGAVACDHPAPQLQFFQWE